MLQLTCPSCASSLNIPEGMSGPVKCPGCKTVFTVPAPVQPPPPPAGPAQQVQGLPRNSRTLLAIMWGLCFVYLGLVMMALLGGVTPVGSLPFIVGPVAICYAFDRMLTNANTI